MLLAHHQLLPSPSVLSFLSRLQSQTLFRMHYLNLLLFLILCRPTLLSTALATPVIPVTCSSNSLPGTQSEGGEIDRSYLNLIGSSPALTTTVQPYLHHDATTPSYVLHRCESYNPAVGSSHLANDPRLLFCGAPSARREDFAARLLQRASTEAIIAAASSRKIT